MPQNQKNNAFAASWGDYNEIIQEWVVRCHKTNLIKRLWAKDPTLWKKKVSEQNEITNRLGWLQAVEKMVKSVGELTAFGNEIKEEGFKHVVLLGMGGSSLGAEVFQNVFGNAPGYPELLILDSTDPARVSDVEKSIDLAKTVFVLSSKSGGTIEPNAAFKYFFEKVKIVNANTGHQFIAITDPGTLLDKLAKSRHFRRIFSTPEDVGGRFSVLTYFGLVPAVLIGVDVSEIVKKALEMVMHSSAEEEPEENSALILGIAMAVLAESGRNKLTIVTPEGLESFGDWAEQLVAESTGKEEMGVVPIVRESLAKPELYGKDRFFVALSCDELPDEKQTQNLKVLAKAGHPVLTLKMKNRASLGAEFYRWEVATAVACSLMKINCFDQPDVQSAKEKTTWILKKIEMGQGLSMSAPKRTLESVFEDLAVGDYVALLAFLPARPSVVKCLESLRLKVREYTKRTATVGIGPRYLHSTGQLHKGGPNSAIFILVTTEHSETLAIPGEKYNFKELELAQALGDLEALESKERSVCHVHLPGISDKELDAFSVLFENVLKAQHAVPAN